MGILNAVTGMDLTNDRDTRPTALVLGGSGIVGSALVRQLGVREWRAISVARPTLRGPRVFGSRDWRLDLGDPRDISRLFSLVDSARPSLCFVAYGPHRFADCEADPLGTRRINVKLKSMIVRKLATLGVHTNVLSTRAVFEPSQPFPEENDAPRPEGEYGRQMADLEQAVLGQTRVRVSRLTKVLSRDRDPWLSWIAKGRFQDQLWTRQHRATIAPLYSDELADSLIAFSGRYEYPITHHSASDEICWTCAGLYVRAHEIDDGEHGSQAFGVCRMGTRLPHSALGTSLNDLRRVSKTCKQAIDSVLGDVRPHLSTPRDEHFRLGGLQE